MTPRSSAGTPFLWNDLFCEGTSIPPGGEQAGQPQDAGDIVCAESSTPTLMDYTMPLSYDQNWEIALADDGHQLPSDFSPEAPTPETAMSAENSPQESTALVMSEIPDTAFLARVPSGNPVLHFTSTLVMQNLRAFVQMMARKETFPPFVHSHSYQKSMTGTSTLPQPLVNCMGVAQMFASRTCETRPFLWRTVRMEQRSFIQKQDDRNYSARELLAAIQAQIIYIIMRAVDDEHMELDLNQEMVVTHQREVLEYDDGDVLLDVKSLRCISYEVAVPQTEAADRPREPYMQTVWQPNVDTLISQDTLDALPKPGSETDLIANMLELMQHKRPLSKVLLLGQNNPKSLRAVLETASSGAQVTLADVSEEQIKTLTGDIETTDLTRVVLGEGLSKWPGLSSDVYDLVVAGQDAFTLASGPQLMKTIFDRVSKKGRALISASAADRQFLIDTVSRSGFLESNFFFDFPGSTVVCANRTDSGLKPCSPTGKKVTVLTSNAARVPAHAPLVALLQESGCQMQVVDISSIEPLPSDPGSTYIVHDTRASLLTELSEKTFDRLKLVLTGNNPIIWLTEGVNEGDSVAGGMSQGLLRVIRSEQASARILLMDLAKDEDVKSVAAAITSVLGKVPTKASGDDSEFWLQNGVLNVPRVLPNGSLNGHFSAELASPQPSLLSPGQNLTGKIENGALVFEAQDENALAELSEYDVEMTVQYASVEAASASRADVAQSVVTGVIQKVGCKLDAALVGQDAVAYASSPFSTVLRVPISAGTLYSGVGATSLVATLPYLAKAVDSVLDVGKVQGSDHVVLLPAQQSFVAAVRELQKALDFKLTTIVDSERQKSELAPGNQEVLLASDSRAIRSLFTNHKLNLVVAQDFSPFSQEIWRSMPASSRFVLNDSTIDGSLDTVPLSKGVAFLLSGVKSMAKHRPAALGDLLARTMEFMKKHQISWTPSVFETEELSSSNQLFAQGSGSLSNNVLKFEPGSSSIMVKSSAQKLSFSPDAAYLLVGCLGGLGRSLTTFMMERGARDFVFLSRSGIDKPEAAALVDSIQKAGARTQIFRGDASVEKDVEHAIAEVTASRSIKGVVHAAMVLQDGVFDNMSYNQFQAALRPKVDGARVLHDAFQTAALDFFVVTSSISATMGNPGQANYSAANSYLDALAWHRNLKGLPATSLILPMVLGVGVVAESEGLEEALSRKAMYGIDEQELLRAFETAMLQTPTGPAAARSTPGSSQIIFGLEPAYLASAIEASSAGTEEAYWFNDGRFSHLRAVIDQLRASGKSASGSRDGGSFARELKAAQKDGKSAVLHILCQHIAAKLASMLLIPVEDFAFEGKSIAMYGIDSMIGANLRNWLFNQFALELSFQTLLSPKMSILALAHTVGEHLGVVTADA
ncbi:hypothetical protein CKM354_001116100 [Cercospora kikuchii]|uniref:Ketoreductase domain-containing protein n=1 Tax=Cercospora kikuchii TaxID=84275 RepID=A0A9P3D009_9PEZI|nr:uncharacterized protein CKM354_001116100 [Cercospora kikuchii]GIZ48088.1 hypothetical protein CKM354_001116100 [Cercospora kikuchii]